MIPRWHWVTPIAGTPNTIVTEDYLSFDSPPSLVFKVKFCYDAKCDSWTSVVAFDYLNVPMSCNGPARSNGAFARHAGTFITPAGIAAEKADADAKKAAIDAEIEAKKSFWEKNTAAIVTSTVVAVVVVVGGIIAWKRGLFGAKKQPQTEASA
ncbi:hypothetical protein BC831DRAFT_469324 [Entophlyctis helioformis]|nr:hypothetical protein BC831DRAFT_469324 [Entophlyctis helioformis]